MTNWWEELAKVDPKRLPEIAASEEEARRRDGTWSGGVREHTEYRDRPVDWIVEKLKVEEETIRWSMLPEYEGRVWDGTEDPLVVGLEAISRGESIAVSSATNVGKSYVLGAAMALWFLAVYRDSIVLTIAPREKQLTKNLWKYIGKFWPQFNKLFPDAVIYGRALQMYGDDPDKRELWTATALTAAVGAEEEVAQNLAGFHQPEMLWILEETPGIETPIINTILNTATGRWNPICALGNRDHQYDALGQLARKSRFHDIRMSAYDFPNIVTGRNIVDGAVTQQSIDDRLDDADGDENDPIYLSRVRGIAPRQSKRALILWDWCEAAAARWEDKDLRDGELALGVDPADKASGDSSAIARWQGACCTQIEIWRAEDASEVGRTVFQEMINPKNPVDPRHVGIDAIGIGASTINELKRLGVTVRGVSGQKAVPRVDVESRWSETEADEDGRLHPRGPRIRDVTLYANTRSQVFWQLREDLRMCRIALPNDKKLFEELTAMEYKLGDETGGKVKVLPKKELKAKIGGRSPDRADAVAYGNFVRHREPSTKQLSDEEMVKSGMVIGSANRDIGLERMAAKVKKRRAAEDRKIERRYGRKP